MFIKVFVPNHNGKIELSVKELEVLIQEAVDKAITEDRANRPYHYGGLLGGTGITYLNAKDSDKTWDWNKVTCNDSNNATLLNSNTSATIGINKSNISITSE